jgi:hypothetical protein
VTYFFDDDVTTRIDDQIAQVSAWCDYEAWRIAERIVQLSPRDRKAVTSTASARMTSSRAQLHGAANQ